jgi:hypothetical protein
MLVKVTELSLREREREVEWVGLTERFTSPGKEGAITSVERICEVGGGRCNVGYKQDNKVVGAKGGSVVDSIRWGGGWVCEG